MAGLALLVGLARLAGLARLVDLAGLVRLLPPRRSSVPVDLHAGRSKHPASAEATRRVRFREYFPCSQPVCRCSFAWPARPPGATSTTPARCRGPSPLDCT